MDFASVQRQGAQDAASVVAELGYGRGSTKESLVEVLSQLPALDAAGCARLVSMMACTLRGLGGDNSNATWDPQVLAAALATAAPSVSPDTIAQAFDQQGVAFPNAGAFQFLMQWWGAATGGQPYPVATFASGKAWEKNMGAQLELIGHASSAPPELITFARAPRLAAPLEGLAAGRLPHGTPNRAWLCLSVVESLCSVAAAGHVDAARSVLERPAQQCPEVLLVAFAEAQVPWGTLHEQVFGALLPRFLLPHPNSAVLIRRVFPAQPAAVTASMAALRQNDPPALGRLLDVAVGELGALDDVLAAAPNSLAAELATLASMRGALPNLGTWIDARVAAKPSGPDFVRAAAAAAVGSASDGALPPNSVAALLSALHKAVPMRCPEANDALRAAVQAAVSKSPQLAQLLGGGEGFGKGQGDLGQGGLGGSDAGAVNDVEAETNAVFQNLYSGETSVEDVVNMLQRYKASGNKREADVFACMVHNLFDEVRFFSKYPTKELRITAVLFGMLVARQLVANTTLGMALRYVLESLRQPYPSKMFLFGIVALEQFKDQLSEWPQYCSHIVQIQGIQQASPELFEAIQSVVRGNGVGTGSGGGGGAGAAGTKGEVASSASSAGGGKAEQAFAAGVATATTPDAGGPTLHLPSPADAASGAAPSSVAAAFSSGGAGLPTLEGKSMGIAPSFSTLNVDTLMAAAAEQGLKAPTDAVQDKVFFITNNLSNANLPNKSKEIASMITEEYYPWFSQYLVVKRASIEPNFHALYHSLLDKLALPKLNKEILKATYTNAKILLNSDKIKSSSSERSLLKNLGLWLGAMTLAKNRPVLYKDLALKELIIDAYKSGKMIAVMPFVSKVLEHARDSMVFRPPNPWTMAIVGLISEIYQKPDLKLNLKFEVEIMVQKLQLDLSAGKSTVDESIKIETFNLLDNVNVDLEGNPDFNHKREKDTASGGGSSGAGHGSMVSAGEMGGAGGDKEKGGPYGTGFSPAATAAAQAFQQGASPDVAVQQYIQISPQMGVLAQQLQLKRLVPVAIDRAIREIIAPVVERSVTIACMTSRELIVKDFAMESDEGQMRAAAHLMVSSLAGSLALVTCREPLRVSMANHHRQLMQEVVRSAGVSMDAAILDQAVQVVTADNLELGCALIEKAATEKAIRDVDEALSQAYTARRKHRETTHGSQPFYDMAVLSQGRFPGELPELLRPKPGPLSRTQQRVYDDFTRIPKQALYGSAASGGGSGGSSGGTASGGAGGAGTGSGASGAQASSQAPPASAEEAASELVNAALTRLDGLLRNDEGTNTFDSLPSTHEARAAVAEARDAVAAVQPARRPAVAGAGAMRALTRLLESPPSARILHGGLAAAVAAIAGLAPQRVPKDVATALAHALGANELTVRPEHVVALLRAHAVAPRDVDSALVRLAGGRHTEFAALVVQGACVEARAVPASELTATMEALSKAAAGAGPNDPLSQLLEAARSSGRRSSGSGPGGAAAASAVAGAAAAASDKRGGDRAGLREQAVALFEEWARVYEAGRGAATAFVAQLQAAGLTRGDETTERLLLILMELCTAHCVASGEAAPGGAGAQGAPARLNFQAVDAFAKLALYVIKGAGQSAPGQPAPPPQVAAQRSAAMLTKVLGVAARALVADADEQGAGFNARPYFRLLVTWSADLTSAVDGMEGEAGRAHALSSLAQLYVAVQPLRVPAFAFAWLELVSHRTYMPKMLANRAGWDLFKRLIVAALRFVEPALGAAELSEPMRVMYRGVLRVLLVLLHDAPSFLCEHHAALCDAIPLTCVQLRNLVLSAFPAGMRLPDPFTPNLKVDMLPEITQVPRMAADAEQLVPSAALRRDMQALVQGSAPAARVVQEALKSMRVGGKGGGGSGAYATPAMNGFVLHLGSLAVAHAQSKGTSVPAAAQGAPMEVMKYLVAELDAEGRYLLFNALSNQLRYPNAHTHLFSCLLLQLFAEAPSEAVQEQITRVLLERLIVNRPHPWGLLVSFIELIKNPTYSFWARGFTRCAPEIERLFQSVARSCVQGGDGGQLGGGGGAGAQQQPVAVSQASQG